MKNFIKKYILNNFWLKVLSLIVAVIVWVAYTNINDPLTTQVYVVKLDVENAEEYEEQNRYIEIEGTDDYSDLTVNCYVRARTSVIDKLKSRSTSTFLKAYIDLYEIDPDDPNRLMIHYEITDSSLNAEIITLRNKSYVTVDIEDNVTKEISIEYEITGEPAEGYMYLKDDEDIRVTPQVVTLTGPSGLVEAVDHAYVKVSIEGASANENEVGSIKLIDADGNTLNYSQDVVTRSVNEVSVFVPIYTYKTIALQPYLTGKAQDGYEYASNIQLDVTEIEVYGPESTLNKINSLGLPEINLSEITGEYSQRYNLQTVLNSNYGKDTVRLMDSSAKYVTVTLSVLEQEELTLSIKTSDIIVSGLGSDYEISFDESSVTVKLRGLPANVEGFDTSQVKLYLRFSAGTITTGKQSVTLSVTGTGKLTADTVTCNVNITEVAEESEETGSDAETD